MSAVHDLSEWTDPTTERMRQETGHDCIACPSAARDLFGVAHNALGQWDAIRDTVTDARMHRKMASLRDSVTRWQAIVDGHFAALEGWRRP